MNGGYRFALAPRFPSSQTLAGRLDRNGGTEREGQRILARNGWTPLDPAETSAAAAPPPGQDLRPGELAFFRIPERLRAAWWTEAERQAEPDSHHTLSEILEFLKFKRLPLPDRTSLSVAASLPELASTRTGRDGASSGLGFGHPPPVASINLGDEPSWVVVLPLPPLAMAERLDGAGVSLAHAGTPPELTARFFDAFPDEPLLRFRLDPGDGLWFPADGVVHDGWTRGRAELDVVLHLVPELIQRKEIA